MTETIDVQSEEYVFGADDERLVYTGDGLVHVGHDEDLSEGDRIPLGAITDVRTSVDRSVTGFRTIGIVLGLVALLFTAISISMLANGFEIDVVTAGTVLSAAVGWFAAVQYFRAEHGSLRVIAVTTAAGEFVFYTQSQAEPVDRFVEVIRNRDARATADDSSPAVQ